MGRFSGVAAEGSLGTSDFLGSNFYRAERLGAITKIRGPVRGGANWGQTEGYFRDLEVEWDYFRTQELIDNFKFLIGCVLGWNQWVLVLFVPCLLVLKR